VRLTKGHSGQLRQKDVQLCDRSKKIEEQTHLKGRGTKASTCCAAAIPTSVGPRVMVCWEQGRSRVGSQLVMSGVPVLGVVLAIASALFNGSFGALSKVEAIQRAAVTPIHFNSWVAVGLIVSTLPLLAFAQVSSAAGAACLCLHCGECTCSGNATIRHAAGATVQVLTPWGMLSGVLFVSSTGCTFFAIDLLGVSVASAIWCGTAMLAAFIWGLRCGNPHHGFIAYATAHTNVLVFARAGQADGT
jgi:hypothetical protein